MTVEESLNNINTLTPEDLRKLISISQRVTLAKNNKIIDFNKTEKYIYILTQGICRIYYPKNEKEVILDFCFPGDIILPLNSYVHGTQTYEIVDCLEECICYKISIDSLQHLYANSLNIANWGRKLAELETLKIEERLIQSLFKSAAERYQELLDKAPKLLHRIKLGYIASYLGVSQVTLSRIRADVK